MAEQSTYIKIDRNLKRWRWFRNRNTLQVFLLLLMDANIVDHEFEHEIIHRGEVATSLRTLCMSTGLSIREIRTAISHLKSTGEVTSRSCNRYQVFTIVNYDKYQDKRQAKGQADRQASDKQATSKRQQYKNIKNDKNGKNIIPPKSPKGDLTPSGEKQWDNLHAETMMPRDMGTYDDIPSVYRDGTYQSFKTWEEYWDWSNQ